MKKIAAGILSIIIVLSLGMSALADETISEKDGSKQIDVQAKAVYISPENMYIKGVSGGNASITIQGGATVGVSAKGTTFDGLKLNVIQIASGDTQGYNWLSGAMGAGNKGFAAYDIYFTDNDGDRFPTTEETTVSITTPEGYANTQVYLVNPDGSKKAISSTQSDGKTVFTATEFGYYVLADKATGGTINPDSPQTGDTSNLYLWISLLLIFGVALTILCSKTARKRKGDR